MHCPLVCRMNLTWLLVLLISIPLAAQKPADLVLTGGKVVTVDSGQPEARALAARGDSIVAVGSEKQIADYIGPETLVIDLNGRLVVPGFIDGHGHFMSLGRSLLQLDLSRKIS